jgi:4-diphosphocytidyl-2-C-methyl-D-erythritol kinase
MLVLKAPAKINLTLEILSRRADGYHTLRSVMVPVGLYDEIELEPAAEGSFAAEGVDLDGDNLVTRALSAAGAAPQAARLRKNIPVGGGLGGGSSDAAAVLLAAIDGHIGSGDRDWVAQARGLGSDVPFFLSGTAALVESTGERLTPLGAFPPWWALIVQPRTAVPTALAYRLLDEAFDRDGWPSRPRSQSTSLAAVDALQRSDFGALRASLHNDFHDVILAADPQVRAAFEAMREAGSPFPLLSGSGACLFDLFQDERAARAVESALRRESCERTFVAPFTATKAWR